MSTVETRQFPTAVIASVSTGILLCKFEDMHEAAEYLTGHSVWTHHFASKDLLKSMQKQVLAQCPGMPTTLEGVTRENYTDYVAKLNNELGETVTIRKGNGDTAMDPLEGIPAGKTVTMIEVGQQH